MVSIDDELLERIDEVVKRGYYKSRSEFIREAVRQLLFKYLRMEGR